MCACLRERVSNVMELLVWDRNNFPPDDNDELSIANFSPATSLEEWVGRSRIPPEASVLRFVDLLRTVASHGYELMDAEDFGANQPGVLPVKHAA